MTLDELDWYPANPDPVLETPRKCRRHDRCSDRQCADFGRHCLRCGNYLDPERQRRGKSSLRAGKDAERAIAKAYGGRRTGMYGGPDDVVVGELFVVQSKAGRTWFRQAYVDELDKLPRTGGRIPTLIVSSRPGPGHPTRRYVVRDIDDDVALHGEKR